MWSCTKSFLGATARDVTSRLFINISWNSLCPIEPHTYQNIANFSYILAAKVISINFDKFITFFQQIWFLSHTTTYHTRNNHFLTFITNCRTLTDRKHWMRLDCFKWFFVNLSKVPEAFYKEAHLLNVHSMNDRWMIMKHQNTTIRSTKLKFGLSCC